jgi:hypothetical protein
MKNVFFVAFGIIFCVCGFIFIFSTEPPVIMLPSKPLVERISVQWNRFKAYVVEKVEALKYSIRLRLNKVRQYIEMDIFLPLYIRFVGLPHQ